MAVQTIKEIHERLLQNFGGAEQCRLSTEANFASTDAPRGLSGASRKPVGLEARQPPTPNAVSNPHEQLVGLLEVAATAKLPALRNGSATSKASVNGTPKPTGQSTEKALGKGNRADQIDKPSPADIEQPQVLQGDAEEAGPERSSLNTSTETSDEVSDEPEKIHFIVWEVEFGARIYKVPERKLDSLQSQTHADRFKVFENFETAKAEANAVFKKVTEERAEKGLPKSILEPVLNDLTHWNESDVPSYFL